MFDVHSDLERVSAPEERERRKPLPEIVGDDQRNETGVAKLWKPRNRDLRQAGAIKVTWDVDTGDAHLLRRVEAVIRGDRRRVIAGKPALGFEHQTRRKHMVEVDLSRLRLLARGARKNRVAEAARRDAIDRGE